eukprot:XP_014060229.1 PREDICTED: cilia- and flagella-associated protein 61-like [Salmo salar]
MRLAVSADRPAVCDMVKRLGWNTLADYIRANYNIKNVIYFSHHCYEEYGKWCHFALNPIFQHYAKHFPKRALQLAHKSCLYYPIYPSCHSQGIVYPLDELGINTPSKQITKDQTSHGYCDRDHTQLSLRSWINVVTGKRVGIDRAVKHVLVSGGRKVPYDHLIFYTGQQYQLFTDKEKIRQSLFGCLAPLLPRVNYDAFQSNNNACLVYDGRLVIDTTFHTSDSTIRAVRPLTKFPRHYHSDRWSHSRFNSREVVQELAAILLPFFDLSLEPAINPPADLDGLITNYTQAKI